MKYSRKSKKMNSNKRISNKKNKSKRLKYTLKTPPPKKVNFSQYPISNSKKSDIIKMFLEMINMVKLYHWKTRSYSEHKATDELYENLSEKIDRFLEVLMGKDQTRINLIESKIKLLDPDSTKLFKDQIFKYREFLEDIDIYFDRHSDSDLLSIRDDILADLNQFLYLLSMNK